jgi:hypothetical protein
VDDQLRAAGIIDLEAMLGNGVRMIIVESVSRFARDLIGARRTNHFRRRCWRLARGSVGAILALRRDPVGRELPRSCRSKAAGPTSYKHNRV